MKRIICGILVVLICLFCVGTLSSCMLVEHYFGKNFAPFGHKTMELGEYPKTIKHQNVIITDTVNEKGYYLGNDGEWYAKIVAQPRYWLNNEGEKLQDEYARTNDYRFSNGEEVVEGKEYYFKVEPITWKIVKDKKNKKFLICDNIIDSYMFDDMHANYKDSDIRMWLNEEFYNLAFSDEAMSKILDTEVDNSVDSTDKVSADLCCENTIDKVFLPSYAEMDYGNASSGPKNKWRTATDFAIARGAHIDTSEELYAHGYWWLRSPYWGSTYDDDVTGRVNMVEKEGYTSNSRVTGYGEIYRAGENLQLETGLSASGVVPAITIED